MTSQVNRELKWVDGQPVCPACGASEFKVLARHGAVRIFQGSEMSNPGGDETVLMRLACDHAGCSRFGRDIDTDFEEMDWFLSKIF